MLDFDLAEMYGVETKRLKEQVRRNIERFPAEFMFELTKEEVAISRSQIATLKTGQGYNIKYLPFAFTEYGIVMLSSVLKSKTAVEVNINIIRAFVRMRQYLLSNIPKKELEELKQRIEYLEEDITSDRESYEKQFDDLFNAFAKISAIIQSRQTPLDRVKIEGFKTNNKEKSKEAYKICIEKIKKHKLAMKLIDCEYTFDNNKVLFYFTADGRIDFRELVKDLASVFKTRIELRQIGVRDETKIKGGIGICGRSLCCNTFLSEFVPVSIKMAKEQNLSLNPTKISGVCGRLMCCLKNEQDTYEYLNSKLPNVGDEVKTNTGVKGVVHEVSVLRQRVKLVVTDEKGEKELVDYKVDDLIFRPRKRREKVKMDDELKKLEAMEKKERKSKL